MIKEMEVRMSHEDFCAVVQKGMQAVLYNQTVIPFRIDQVDEVTDDESMFHIRVIFEEAAA